MREDGSGVDYEGLRNSELFTEYVKKVCVCCLLFVCVYFILFLSQKKIFFFLGSTIAKF